jgi:Na+/phosphate symporter
MSFTTNSLPTSPGQTSPVTMPNPKDLENLKKQKQEIDRYKKDIQKSLSEVNKNIQDAFGKSAKQVCLLRLDMIADKLEKISPRLAAAIDVITDDFEKNF